MPDVRTPAVVAPDTVTARVASRAGWIDSLRVAVIAGVIILHAATAYILDIDRYYQERTTSAVTPALLALSLAYAALRPAADTLANLRWEAWPQGTGLLALGVLADERGWLGAVDGQLVRRCGWATVAAALGLVALAVWATVAIVAI